MYREKISFRKALELESLGKILIIDSSQDPLNPFHGQGKQEWKDNFVQLQTKAVHVSPDRLLSHFSAKYVIEVPEKCLDNPYTVIWAYLYGLETKEILTKESDQTEYVYVLVNAGYPDLVKIGITVHDVLRRAKSVSSTGTVFEWVPKFSLPVKKGSAFKIEQQVHKTFNEVRVSSDQGGSREFFKLDPFAAFDKIREVGALDSVGNPIIY